MSIDVRNTSASAGLLGRSGDSGVVGSGSGVVISKDGLILTNNHVAGEGDLTVTFSDGRSFRAKLIKADPVTDLAVIKAEGIDDATPIAFGSSGDLVVGQTVYAMGSPLGLSGTFTSGIVSALHRPVVPTDEDGSGAGVIDAIQTDAPINPGHRGLRRAGRRHPLEPTGLDAHDHLRPRRCHRDGDRHPRKRRVGSGPIAANR